MKYFIAKTTFNYADEFEVEGYKLINENEAAMLKDIAPKIDKLLRKYYRPEGERYFSDREYHWSFGSNEDLTFDYRHLYSDGFELKELSDTSAAELLSIGMGQIGLYVDAFELWESMSDELAAPEVNEEIMEDENFCSDPDAILEKYHSETFII